MRIKYLLSLIWLLVCWLPNAHAINYIDRIAGNGIPGYSGDGGDAKEASIMHPRGLAIDRINNLYIADTENHRIRKRDIRTGIITTVAGGNKIPVPCNETVQPQSIKAIDAIFYHPISVAVDNNDNLYILVNTNCVYKVSSDGYIIPFIGSEKRGYDRDIKKGEKRKALGVEIDSQYGDISLDPKNDYLYLSDRNNHCIRRVNIKTEPHMIETVAGKCEESGYDDKDIATNVRLKLPEDVVIDREGNMYIADTGNHVIRYVDNKTNILITISGNKDIPKHGGDGGPAIKATFYHPIDLALDNSARLFIVDQNSHRIRYIDTDENRTIRTFVGSGKQGYGGDGDDARDALLNQPKDIAIMSDIDNGSFMALYLSDKRNHMIRKVEWTAVDFTLKKQVLLLFLFISILLLIIAYYLRWYLHPISISLSIDTSKLLTIPITQLSKTNYLLQKTHRLNTVLDNNEITKEWLKQAINFATLSNVERCNWLTIRLNAVQKNTDNANIFNLKLDEIFPLKVENFTVYFASDNLAETTSLLKSKIDAGKIILVISLKPDQQTTLRTMAKNLVRSWVIPDNRELTNLLLSPEPIKTFANLLASQLKISNISPYQTQKSIRNDSGFFGRESILAQIFYSEPTNYIIAGGRSTGKTSLLKKIERYYKDDPEVECLYICLATSKDLQGLNTQLGLPSEATLPILYKKLADVPTGKRRLILFDESDLFIYKEMEDNNYNSLKYFRALSENDQCYFIFTGFWELYQAAILNYHSPLNNFGEFIQLGALEYEACQDLITKPMALLGITYHSKELINNIIIAYGQRANLLSIACSEMIKKLPFNQRILTEKEVQNTFNSSSINNALAGWRQLSEDKEIDRLARIIVYATANSGKFSSENIMNILNEHNYIYTTVQLDDSLKYLELAYIIYCNVDKNNIYHYCVPKFPEYILRGPVEKKLEEEFKS